MRKPARPLAETATGENEASRAAPETESAKQSQLRAIAAQLSGKPAEKQGDPPADKPAGAPKGKPKNLDELAERLAVEVKDLYDVEIPSAGDGEPIKLGKLKDHYADRENFTVAQLRFEETKSASEQAFTRAEQELQTLMALLPEKALKPELRDAVRARLDKHRAEQSAEVLKVIPEWKNAATRETEEAGITEHLSSYGFPTTYLKGVLDARSVKYIRDNWLRELRIRKALELVTEKPDDTPARGGGKGGGGKAPNAQQGLLSREDRERERYLNALR